MTSEVNIIKSIANYDSTKVEENILNLKRELKDQQNINMALNDKNFEEKSKNVTDFIERNEGQIVDQLNRLTDVVDKLKNVVTENLELDSDQDEYRELISSQKSIEIASKLNELKRLKRDALIFLESAGITPQNLN
tara:strand:- start:1107 stop:1514 length:408 start_codon:yes stop_codon:yes gene_type:complete